MRAYLEKDPKYAFLFKPVSL